MDARCFSQTRGDTFLFAPSAVSRNLKNVLQFRGIVVMVHMALICRLLHASKDENTMKEIAYHSALDCVRCAQ